MRYLPLLVLLGLSTSARGAGEAPHGFVLDGTLYDSPSGSRTLTDTGTIRVQILNPAKNCVLYDEQQAFDTRASDGAFSVSVGTAAGSGRRVSGSDAGNSMPTVFQNRTAIGGTGSCAYSPSAGDVRYARVYITPASTGVTDQLSPDMMIGSVPSAIVADTLQGLDKGSFLQLGAESLSQANVANVFTNANYSVLSSLLASGGSSAGGSASGSYVINAGTGGSGGINFNVNGSNKASISNGGDFTVGSSSFFVGGASGKVGVGTTSPSFDLGLGGQAAKTIAMERNTTNNTAGNSLTVGAGSATTAATDKNGGDLYLASGVATGAGSSNIYLQTASAGASGTSDRSPSTKMTIVGNGNVGIGTASPGNLLHIVSSDTSRGLTIENTSSTAWRSPAMTIQNYHGGFGGYPIVNLSNAGGSRSSQATLASNEILGALSFQGNTANFTVTTGASIVAQAADAFSATSAPTNLAFSTVPSGSTSAATRMTIQSSGRVAIGPHSSAAPLDVATGTTAGLQTALVLRNSANSANGNGASLAFRAIDSAPAGLNVASVNGIMTDNATTAVKGELSLSTMSGSTLKEAVRIASNGNVGIGTTNPTSRLYVYENADSVDTRLDVKNASTTGTSATLGVTAGNYWNEWRAFSAGASQIQTNAPYLIFNLNDASAYYSFFAGGAERARITSGGNVGIGTTNPGYKLDVNGTIRGYGITDSSDARLKRDVQPLQNDVRKIRRLRGVSYLWKNEEEHGTGKQIGVIAQEVEKVYPELVATDSRGMKSVNYSHLVAPLIEALKALAEKVDGAENRLAGLFKQSAGHSRELAALRAEYSRLENRVARAERDNEAKARELAAIQAYLCAREPKAAPCGTAAPGR